MNDPAFYLYSYSGGWQEPIIMGDEVAAETSIFATSSQSAIKTGLFQWKDSIYITADMTAYTLNVHNAQVYTLNKIINEVMASDGGTDEQKKP